jgi:murein DD-endopeptidase MepM/ murein hydrolase activator NlpD
VRSLLLVVLLLALAGAAVLAWPRLEGTAPDIEAPAELSIGEEGRTLHIHLADSGRGLRSFDLRLLHAGGGKTLVDERFAGGWLAGAPPGGESHEIEVVLDAAALGIADGPATLVMTARDWSWRNLFRGNRSEARIRAEVDTRPPQVFVESGLTYVYRGGSGAVAYRVNEETERDGVRVGDAFFPGHPAPGASEEEGRRFALFAVPVEAPPSPPVRVVAVDLAGNEGSAGFPVHIFERRFPGAAIPLSDAFLEQVAVPLARDEGIDASDPVRAFQRVNAQLRERDEARIRELVAETSEVPLWSQAFQQLPGSKVTSRFAERRTYLHGERKVAEAIHYGFDLASTSATPVTASNTGRVLFAGPLGIYGNCVLLDHGLGLSSLYGHLSRIDVSEGDEVERGDVLGLSGSTGLAGGDHLHFAILVGGVYVDPLEWWDPKWVHSHVQVRMEPGDQAG